MGFKNPWDRPFVEDVEGEGCEDGEEGGCSQMDQD